MDDVLTYARIVLGVTPARWINLTKSMPLDLLILRPAASEWSALECLIHIYDTERWVFPTRVRAFLKGEDFPAFHPEEMGTRLDEAPPPADLAAEFARSRSASLLELESLTVEDLSLQAVHGELGPVTLGQMIHEWAAHDLMHTVQAERALMQPFIQGSGPWVVYFNDHLIGK